MENILYKFWTNVSKPGSYVGVDKLYKAIKLAGHKITRKQVEIWLKDRFTFQLHKPVKKRFPRKSVIVSGPNILWDVDLLDLKGYLKHNYRYRYILTVIDVFSHKAYGEALTNKSSATAAKAFEKILEWNKTESVRTDHGNEFKREFNAVLKANGIKHILTSSPEIKANYVERFHRTFRDKLTKYMTYNNTLNWTKTYKSLIDSYNNTPHSSIMNVEPNNVDEKNIGILLKHMLKKNKIKTTGKVFKLGDLVRISKLKKIFTKASKETFTDELFVITKISDGLPKMYTLRDLKGESVIGSFYSEELQLAESNAIDHKRIDKAINTGKNKFKVSFKNWPKAFDTVLDKKQVDLFKKPK